ncbi:transposase [Treponema sp.]|uniref:transposase n=1 Tax=Treponema sp. TaxID=166 RepID=UPI00298DC9E5|nr:transposase [Treponema sp.]
MEREVQNEIGLHFIDSTPISTCLNRRIFSHKVTKEFASRGKPTKGWFYGFKLHGVCSEKGLLESVVFTKILSKNQNLNLGLYRKKWRFSI